LIICFFALPVSLRAECDREALKAALIVKLTMKGGMLFPGALQPSRKGSGVRQPFQRLMDQNSL
jgi:hypothetical protein